MDEISKQQLRDNVAAGKLAREIVDMVRDDLPNRSMQQRFVSELRDQLLGPPEPDPEPQHEPWERVVSVTLQYGIHAGEMLKDVPFSYLDWLVGQQEYGLRELQAYMKHPETREKRDREHV